MYNRYLTAAAEPAAPTSGPAEPSERQAAPAGAPPAADALAGLPHLLGGRLQNLHLDMDTLLVLGIVWFLLSDHGEIDWDTLLMIGALLLLGI